MKDSTMIAVPGGRGFECKCTMCTRVRIVHVYTVYTYTRG